MWILLRLLFAAVAAFARACWPRMREPEQRNSYSGGPWVLSYTRVKSRITGTSYGVPLQNSFYFKLTREGGTDRLFKWLGFSSEMQTEDEAFDRHIYVACDHTGLPPLLKEDVATRQAVCRLFQGGVHSIWTDGNYLWVYQNGDICPEDANLNDLQALANLLKKVPDSPLRFLQDPFFRKALLAESLTWGIALYGAPGLLELWLLPHPLYVSWMPVLGAGLLFAAFLFLLLMLALAWFLDGSSRTHRLVVESALLLALGLPWTGVEIVSDANMALDTRPAQIQEARITDKYTRITRGRKGRKNIHYYLELETRSAGSTVPFPKKMEVNHRLYNQAEEGKTVEMHIRPGLLNFPWMEQVRVL